MIVRIFGPRGRSLRSLQAMAIQRQAEEFDSPLEREITLYLVHGLLHLVGYEDATPSSRDEMDALQEGLLAELLEA